MRKITITCVDAGGGHACGLAIGLKKYGTVTSVWRNKSLHKLDSLVPGSKFGFNHIPPKGDDLIIVSCITHDHLKIVLRQRRLNAILGSYKKIHIVITDSRYMRDPDYYNRQFTRYDVSTTGCKRHFRGDLPTKTYYQPFDLSKFDKTKNDNLTIGHSPFTHKKFRQKGTEEIIEVTDKYNFDLITTVSWKECLIRKARCHIFVDQIDHYDTDSFKFTDKNYVWPALGKSGLEAMHLGCLVITHGKGYDTDIPAPPVAWCNGNFKEVLEYYIKNESERLKLAAEGQAWALKYSSYDFAAQQVLK